MRFIWNTFFFSDYISTAAGDISKMKNSSKSNFRPPPHCGCEANAPPRHFDVHFVFAEIESNAIARHYSSSLFPPSTPLSVDFENAFFFSFMCTCVCINSAIARFNFARVAKMSRDTPLKWLEGFHVVIFDHFFFSSQFFFLFFACNYFIYFTFRLKLTYK